MPNIVFKSEIRARILSTLVFVVRCAPSADPQFIAGALAFAEHRALSEGLDWSGILKEVADQPGLRAVGSEIVDTRR